MLYQNRSKFFINAVSMGMALVLSTLLPAYAKLVSLDFTNANRSLDSVLKPYHSTARKQIEANWEQVDPCCGKKIIVNFMVLANGKIVVPESTSYINDETDPRLLPLTSLFAVNYLPPLPEGQDDLLVTGIFQSKKAPMDQELVRARTKRTLQILAVLAVGGAAATGLILWANSMKGSNDNSSSNYHWVRRPSYTNGIYKPGYWQSNANDTILDNFSTRGNINPFTGQPGWVVP